MFDPRSTEVGSGGTVRSCAARSPRQARAGRVADIRHSELRIEAMVLRDAAGWAIEHGVDADDPFATGPAGGVGKYVASDGTPWIDEHVAKEYGALRGTSTFEATDLIIDALDLRHRFPRLWRSVRDLRVRVRFARKISKSCRELSQAAAAAVDAELARKAAWGLPWARLEKILTAAIMNADPELHRAKLAAAKFDRQVWLSETEDGLRTMVIKADAGDQILLYALIDRIAEILLLDGDTDPVAVRRSKASGWLARPEDLVVLLYRHSVTGDQPSETASSSSPAGTGESGEPAEPETPQPPADWPDYDWDRPEPSEDPGAADHLPPPRSRWHGTDHRPEPEPRPPAWCYQPPEPAPSVPPDPLEPPATRLGCDLPRLVDYLTARGLKPVPPRVVMHVHLTDQTLLAGDGVVRSDEAGPMLLSQLIGLLGRHHCTVSLRPVLDPANLAAVDSYEIPQALRDAVRTRHPASVFPYSSRIGKHLELDHTIRHTRTSEPSGQTRIGNLGPLAHPEHQAKTDGIWHVEQPHPGVFLWRSPHGYYFLVTNFGTQALGPRPGPRPPPPTPLRPIRLDDRRRHRR